MVLATAPSASSRDVAAADRDCDPGEIARASNARERGAPVGAGSAIGRIRVDTLAPARRLGQGEGIADAHPENSSWPRPKPPVPLPSIRASR